MTQIEENIRVVKEASCPSLSGRSTLKYQLGRGPSGNHIRISSNSGTGSFSGEWFPLEDILENLGNFPGPFNWEALRPLVKGKSLNTAGFLMGALLDAGLIKPIEKPHLHETANPGEIYGRAYRRSEEEEVSQEAEGGRPGERP